MELPKVRVNFSNENKKILISSNRWYSLLLDNGFVLK